MNKLHLGSKYPVEAAIGLSTSPIVLSMALSFITLTTAILPFEVQAQDSSTRATLRNEGIAGDIDKHHRGPLLSVQSSVSDEQFSLVTEVSVLNEEFSKYPIKIEFFVNRTLVSTQYRSPELPGALGITLSRTEYPLPVNYSVVATQLHPNRTYTTVIQGAIFGEDLTSITSCSLTTTEGEESSTYNSTSLTIAQSGQTTFEISFSGKSESESEIQASGSFSVSDGQASGTISTTQDDETVTTDLTGTATKEGDKLTSLSLSSSDSSLTIECEG